MMRDQTHTHTHTNTRRSRRRLSTGHPASATRAGSIPRALCRMRGSIPAHCVVCVGHACAVLWQAAPAPDHALIRSPPPTHTQTTPRAVAQVCSVVVQPAALPVDARLPRAPGHRAWPPLSFCVFETLASRSTPAAQGVVVALRAAVCARVAVRACGGYSACSAALTHLPHTHTHTHTHTHIHTHTHTPPLHRSTC